MRYSEPIVNVLEVSVRVSRCIFKEYVRVFVWQMSVDINFSPCIFVPFTPPKFYVIMLCQYVFPCHVLKK